MPRTAAWRAWAVQDPDFRRWIDRLARRSQVTAQEYPRVLARFLQREGMAPADVVKLARTKKGRRDVEDRLDDLISRLEGEHKAPGYILNHVKPVKSWLEFNEIRLVRTFTTNNPGATPTLAEERVPSKAELRAILNAATARGRVAVSLVSFGGVRPEVLGNFHGADGLRIRDMPEMRVDDGHVAFAKVPAIVVVRSELSKAKHRYFSFLASEGCDYLKSYIEQRLAAGERLSADSAVVAVAPGARGKGPRAGREDGCGVIATKNVSADIRDAIRRAGFSWRPYVLRAYCDTRLLLAESGGSGNGGNGDAPRMLRDYRAFFMGHRGDIEHRYTVGKGRLPEDLIEDMRRAYQGAEPYLVTTAPAPDRPSPPWDPVAARALYAVIKETMDTDPNALLAIHLQGQGVTLEELHTMVAKVRAARGAPP